MLSLIWFLFSLLDHHNLINRPSLVFFILKNTMVLNKVIFSLTAVMNEMLSTKVVKKENLSSSHVHRSNWEISTQLWMRLPSEHSLTTNLCIQCVCVCVCEWQLFMPTDMDQLSLTIGFFCVCELAIICVSSNFVCFGFHIYSIYISIGSTGYKSHLALVLYP